MDRRKQPGAVGGAGRLPPWLLVLSLALAPAPGWGRDVPERFRDAPAVVLEHDVTWRVRPDACRLSVKKRILILDRRGLSRADQRVSYERTVSRILSFTARTIQPDGSSEPVPADLQHDFLDYRLGEGEWRSLHFTFPGARPGSILEWQYEIALPPPLSIRWWEVQEEIPVLDARFVTLLGGFPFDRVSVGHLAPGDFSRWCEGKGVKHSPEGLRKEVRCKDLPAYEPEPLAPPEAEGRLRLMMTWYPHGVIDSPPAERLWSGVGQQWMTRIREFVADGERSRGIVEPLVRDATSESETVDRVYRYVREHTRVRPELGLEDGRQRQGGATTVGEVLERGGGSPTEIGLLTYALLRAAGTRVRPVLVGDRGQETLLWDRPGLAQDLALILEIELDGRKLHLDPGCDSCQAGIPDWRHGGGAGNGILLDLDAGTVRPANLSSIPPDLNIRHQETRAVLAADGSAAVDHKLLWYGQPELDPRRRLRALSESARRREILSWIGRNAHAATLVASDPDRQEEVLQVTYAYRDEAFAVAVGDRLLLLPPRDLDDAALPFLIHETRGQPLWWPYRFTTQVRSIVVLPEGYRIGPLAPPEVVERAGLLFRGGWLRNQQTGDLEWQGCIVVDRTRIDVKDLTAAREFALALHGVLQKGLIASRADGTGAVP